MKHLSKHKTGETYLAEYIADHPSIEWKLKGFIDSAYVKKVLKKNKRLPLLSVTSNFVADSGNLYIGVLLYAEDSRHNQKKLQVATFVRVINTSRGVGGVFFFSDNSQPLIVTPHFLERYKERYMGVCGATTLGLLRKAESHFDILKVFVRENHTLALVDTNISYDSKHHIFAPTNQGIALIEWDENKQVLQANTFITYKMMNKHQLKITESVLQYLLVLQQNQNKTDESN